MVHENSVIRHREDLRFLDGTFVECSGRLKEFRRHEKRRDLDSICLVNVIVTPVPLGESIYLDHIWVLKKQLSKIDIPLIQNSRIFFSAKVYSYRRLGGKSIDRGLYGLEDYGILPISKIKRDETGSC